MQQSELIDRMQELIIDADNILDDLWEGNFDMSDVSNLATEFNRLAEELEEGL